MDRRINKTIIFMAMLFVFAFAFSQRQSNIVVKEFGPEYRLHYTLYPAENAGKGELQLKLEMPYDEILFIKNNSHYKAKFEFSVMIHDNQIQVINENFIREVSLDEFRLTNSRKEKFIIKKTYVLDPKEYKLDVLVTDIKTQNRRKISKDIDMTYFSDPNWMLGDLYLVDDIIEGSDSDKMPKAIYFGFTATGYSGHQRFNYTILSADKPVRSAAFSLYLREERHEYRFPLKTDKLGYNEYKLVLETEIEGKTYRRMIPFRLKYAGMSSLIPDMSRAVSQMRYLAMTGYISYKEYKNLKKTEGKGQKDIFESIWKKLDPTPDTDRNELMDEFFFRTRYADMHFSSHQDGWKTDRGMIYAIYGEPDAVEEHTMDLGVTPYEIWFYYSANKQFIFYDYSGLGDYQLSEPMSEY